ncbi:MCE family protein [Streptacidiphilus sp. MAP5-3]|uniref:MCE family protein n=1 Tax=unclassified Streptacidiphilus TaxID=2643834 RepID=UPI003512C46F
MTPRQSSWKRGPLFRPLRDRNPVIVGVVGLVVLLLVGLLAYNADALPFVGGGTHYSADFTEAAGLTSGDEVRVAGVTVGKVTGVALDGAQVRVDFQVSGAWVGNTSTLSIAIKTLLGAKYLAVDPLGTAAQNPSATIPRSRTTSPYDVAVALNGLGQTLGQLDEKQLAQSFQALSDTFRNTPASVRTALTGLSSLSRTISSRDAELSQLLQGTSALTGTLADQNSRLQTLLSDGNLLLAEIQQRRDAIHQLLVGTTALGTQLTGLVQDNQAQLTPTLTALNRVVSVLQANLGQLNQVLALAGPYYRLVTNALGNGPWFDAYLCGLVPRNYLPPGTQPSTGCMPPKAGGTTASATPTGSRR